MAYVQLPTFEHDCSAEAGAEALDAHLPHNVGPQSSIAIVARNVGADAAWLRVDATDGQPSALRCEPAEKAVWGPFRADALPELYGALGARCFVTLLVEGR